MLSALVSAGAPCPVAATRLLALCQVVDVHHDAVNGMHAIGVLVERVGVVSGAEADHSFVEGLGVGVAIVVGLLLLVAVVRCCRAR